ncbi:general secretion pathway protein A [Vibrio ishigakensis]|uniref:General secretion pathway protein A n=1 Tax=Vibrio ishigakensis TaxID=1481914 RepID=A0A0B8PDC3_9VIBR|nr:general secretion pathway protein A [Vibrio ishigakensis]GAM67723.1 general secretion pathway protein A [Vibrio sp. JCM 19236]GAM76949.1 general secretion pathway protein A [Vibrio ishigakensis]
MLSSNASLEQVIASNRPVVLTLYQEGLPFFAVFSHIEQERVELVLNQQRVELPLEWLRAHWQGEFRYLWYSEITETLKLNNSGEQVRQLDKLVAQVLNADPLNTSVFNQELKSRVTMFQEWQGLSADGVAGSRTLRQLDRLTTTKAPSLLGQRKEAM